MSLLRKLWGWGRARAVKRRLSQVGFDFQCRGRVRVDNQGTIVLGNRVEVGAGGVPVELAAGPGARLRVGHGVVIEAGVSLGAVEHIEIGDDVHIGAGSMVVDCDFHDVYDRSRRPPAVPVVIEASAWIGARAIILKGVRIGAGARVFPGAVVQHNVPAGACVAGVPAAVVEALPGEVA